MSTSKPWVWSLFRRFVLNLVTAWMVVMTLLFAVGEFVWVELDGIAPRHWLWAANGLAIGLAAGRAVSGDDDCLLVADRTSVR
jgi:hypothetical protein